MLTVTAPRVSAPTRFVVQAVAAGVALFGILRTSWMEAHVVLPVARLQGAVAVEWLGAPTAPVEVTLACSGTDALALCLAAVLAYPVAWHSRMAGAAGGVALVLLLNTLRIGTLGRAADTAGWFTALHLYIWPALLTMAIACYVFAWMRMAHRAPATSPASAWTGPSRRFIVLSVSFLLLSVLAAPLYLESAPVLAFAGLIAAAAAAILGGSGVTAHADANMLVTSRGAFLVTHECVSTPLIPVYLAGLCVHARTWRGLAMGLAAAVPLFTGLAVARLLVVALPGAVAASPLFLLHAFYQLVLGAVIVAVAGIWRHGRRRALLPALRGVLLGALLVYLLVPLSSRAIAMAAGEAFPDPQGALALLPAFQFGLYAALWSAAFVDVGWGRIAAGVAALGVVQAGALVLLVAIAESGATAHVRDVRAVAVVVPVLIFAFLVTRARTSL